MSAHSPTETERDAMSRSIDKIAYPEPYASYRTAEYRRTIDAVANAFAVSDASREQREAEALLHDEHMGAPEHRTMLAAQLVRISKFERKVA